MKVTALIMAGGKGERFWPRSRKSFPKQFLCLTGDGKSMIQQTVERINPIVKMEDIYIATNIAYKDIIKEQLPLIPEENILYEPVGRNTAPCIGLGAVHIRKKYDDAVMLVLPSDHQIKFVDMYLQVLKDAIEVAELDNNLVTLGITPNAPETGYGYIKYDKDEMLLKSSKVISFVEKPDINTAKKYLESGDYMWNSGMFMWKASTILSSMEKNLPEIYSGLLKIEAAIGTADETKVLNEVFETLPSESVDYGILEKEKSIFVLPGNFGWDDVGSWLSIERLNEADGQGNCIKGNVRALDLQDCIIEGEDKLIACIGLKNIVVVDTKDATLICDKEHTADIKKILEQLRNNKENQYL